MTRLNLTMLGLCFGAVQLLATSAWADSADLEDCYDVGKACFGRPGVCREHTCYSCDKGKAVPYSCKRCDVEPVSSSGGEGGGAGGAEEQPAAAGQPAAIPECPAEKEEDSGCNVRRPSNEASVGAGMLGIGFVALGLSRRRRRQRSGQ
jgi:hypothetical protein